MAFKGLKEFIMLSNLHSYHVVTELVFYAYLLPDVMVSVQHATILSPRALRKVHKTRFPKIWLDLTYIDALSMQHTAEDSVYIDTVSSPGNTDWFLGATETV